jgi:hypothetical protein
MLNIRKPFPALKTTTVGTAVFSIGFIGSFALLNHFQPGMLNGPAANVVTSPSEDSRAKAASATKEASSDKKTGSSSKQEMNWEPNGFVQGISTQPQSQYQPQSGQTVQPALSPSSSSSVVKSPSTSTGQDPVDTITLEDEEQTTEDTDLLTTVKKTSDSLLSDTKDTTLLP